MIAKITTRTDFSGIVNYANDVQNKGARIIGSNGLLLINNETMSNSFEAQLRIPDNKGRIHRISKPVKHISFAFSPKDTESFPNDLMGDCFMKQLAKEWMREMGIDSDKAQYVIVRHFDKPHPHCHLVLNRILNDGSLISDCMERRRNERACRKIKIRHRLSFGNSNRPEINMIRLRRYERSRTELRALILDAKIKSSNWHEFESLLKNKGVILNICFDSSKFKIKGISFEKEGFRISGSKLGCHGAFTYRALSKLFNALFMHSRFNDSSDNKNPPNTAKRVISKPNVQVVIPLERFIIKNFATNSSEINREWELGKKKKHNYDEIDDKEIKGGLSV